MKVSKKLLIILILFYFPASYTITTSGERFDDNLVQGPDNSSELVIYTYDSLLADPGYEFDRAFEMYAGISDNTVEVVLLEDAGSIVTKAVAEKSSPVADVLIGIDNVLIDKARKNDILAPYEPYNSSNLRDGLVEALAPDYLLTPYDYGVISLWYHEDKVSSKLNSDTFVLNDLIDQDLVKQTIVENPNLSSPGLGFLLWTIAVFGDEDAGIDGLVSGDWDQYWRKLSDNLRIVDSWGDALTLFYAEEANRPIMVSYSTSPAYGSCLYEDTSTKAFLSHENNIQWGWQQVEGIGLVKNAPHPDLAKQFIDWFISYELQSQIPQNQWMYPAINDISIPECFDAAIDKETITPLNDRIPEDKLSENLDDWLDKWELAVAEGTDEGWLPSSNYSIIVFTLILPLIVRKFRLKYD